MYVWPVLVPPGVSTVTLTDPAGPIGATATSAVSETTVKAARVTPKRTAPTRVRLAPVNVTMLPAEVGP